MWRINAIVVTCLCAIAGCRGGNAAEPYDGVLVASQTREKAAAAPAAQAPEAEPVASDVDVPWAIALLSDDRPPVAKRPRRATVVRRQPAIAEPVAGEANEDLEVVVVHDHAEAKPVADEKPGTAKVCSGVVNRRS